MTSRGVGSRLLETKAGLPVSGLFLSFWVNTLGLRHLPPSAEPYSFNAEQPLNFLEVLSTPAIKKKFRMHLDKDAVFTEISLSLLYEHGTESK